MIPADRASDSVGLLLHEASQENVKIIIEESAAGDFADGSDEQKVGDRSDEIRDAYVAHIEAMFGMAGLADGESAASMIMALETRWLANI